MKSKLYITIILSFILLTLTTISCNKDINYSEQLPPLQPANIDANAGTWTPIVLTSNSQVAVPAPTDVTSDAYKAELASLKDIQSKLTDGQRKIIAFWSAGGVLRWNQIFRELVARFNLPPVPNADGTYPVPDAENPFSDPMFPFANPPYAARAYSYVSAAQYDALKAAWYYKYKYNRPAPYTIDNGITPLMPQTDLPAYPSEEATMSGAAAEMLKNLFPAAVEEITKKAAEQRNAALWSGKATASDISAGLALGKSVAAIFIARAGSDGMKTALGVTRTEWKARADSAKAHGEIAWKCLESPARPPMLPFFGLASGTAITGVKPWMMTPATMVSIRPVAPPSTSSEKMKTELDEVKYYSDNLTRDRLAIVHKWADGAGTYTPPGHWNDIAEEYIRDAKFSEVRAARAFALINISLHDAAVGCWDTKFYYFNPRPCQLNPEIKTATGVPNFPAFTSGHSTFSGAAANVLAYLFPDNADYFNQQASEASMSRLYGAIHYRSDCEMGLAHGKVIAQYTINFAQQDGSN